MSLIKYLHALKWEFLQNYPMFVGFLIAAWLRPQNLMGALAILATGLFLGMVMMHYTEPLLHKEILPVSWKFDFYNFGLFMVFAIPFLFYFSVDHPLSNWKTDLILGAVLGALLTWGQALTWRSNKMRIVVHGVAMAISLPILMIGFRLLLKISDLSSLVLSGSLLTLLGSAIITLIDYSEMFIEPDKKN
jgi:hypothetical protein